MDPKRAAAVTGVMYYLQQESDEREQEAEQLGNRTRRSGWSSYGRNSVARGRQMVQGRRVRRTMTGMNRGYRPGISRSSTVGDPVGIPHASGMQVRENRAKA